MMIDTHAHCQFPGYGENTSSMMKRTQDKNTIVNIVGTEKISSSAAINMAGLYDFIYASIGLHPGHLFSDYHDKNESTEQVNENDFDFDYYDKLASEDKVIAIGECGIDLYRIPDSISRDKVLVKQIEVFEKEADLASKHNLPLVIHCRSAHNEMINVLKKIPHQTGTIHCYTDDWVYAEQYLEMGYYIGFTGIITFPPQKKDPKSHNKLMEVIKKMPIDRILVETDCPYLAPIPFRGKPGEPWMVSEIIRKIAEIRQEPHDLILNSTTNNAKRLFKKIK